MLWNRSSRTVTVAIAPVGSWRCCSPITSNDYRMTINKKPQRRTRHIISDIETMSDSVNDLHWRQLAIVFADRFEDVEFGLRHGGIAHQGHV